MLYAVTGMYMTCRAGYILAAFASVCFHAGGLSQISLNNLNFHLNESRPSTKAGAIHSSNAGVRELEKTRADADVLKATESNVVQESGKVFKVLNTQVQNIQSQLDAMQNENAQSIAEQKREYEQQLELLQANITDAETMNAKMSSDNEELLKTNTALRKKASMLSGGIERVRLGISQLENNISIAREIAQHTLNKSETLLNATQIEVIRELDEQDLLMQKKLSRAKHMNALGMLQFTSVTSKKKLAPESLVGGMLSFLEDYRKQKTAQENELKTMFETRFQAESARLQTLRDEYKALQATNQSEKELQGRLTIAVQYLEKTYRQLMRQKQALVKFVHTMGDTDTK